MTQPTIEQMIASVIHDVQRMHLNCQLQKLSGQEYSDDFLRAWSKGIGDASSTVSEDAKQIVTRLEAIRAALAEKRGVDDGELWSFMRSTLKQGVDIWHDHVNRCHEEYEARIDSAASERANKLKAALAAQREGK